MTIRAERVSPLAVAGGEVQDGPSNGCLEQAMTIRAMKRAFAVSGVASLLVLALLAACVTVNVYFPAAEAQHAADKIIDAVTGSTAEPPAQGPRSKPHRPNPRTR